MAFKFFKKKENELPTEEKAEILDTGDPGFVADMQNFQPDPDFREGFRSSEELKPPTLQKSIPVHQKEMALPQFNEPTPVPMPPTEPMHMEMHEIPEPPSMTFQPDFGPLPKIKGTPHIYIRVNKYKEVMQAIQNLDSQIQATKEDLEEIHQISETERQKIKESATVLLEIEKLLSYLERTFSSPED